MSAWCMTFKYPPWLSEAPYNNSLAARVALLKELCEFVWLPDLETVAEADRLDVIVRDTVTSNKHEFRHEVERLWIEVEKRFAGGLAPEDVWDRHGE
ncbi:hypothetical protein ACK3TF_004582 [Chlorella vulgaris]